MVNFNAYLIIFFLIIRNLWSSMCQSMPMFYKWNSFVLTYNWTMFLFTKLVWKYLWTQLSLWLCWRRLSYQPCRSRCLHLLKRSDDLWPYQRYVLYTAGWNVWGEWFLAWNQGNHQNFEQNYTQGRKWPTQKKPSFSKSPILNIFCENFMD